ncbi:HU family DNA-binding protein [Paenibacillus sp. FSL R7-0302]|uniref:HU family DNA-binding protein n=1 Tax=Paenibacillus sp. FSL R7-0302 TaxID=2921681 RepID=UPI0030F9787E
MTKVNTEALVERVAQVVVLDEGVKSTKKAAKTYTTAVFAAIESLLAEGNNVAIPGHGVYEIRERDARTGRNPQTGEAIEIPATKTVGLRVTGLKAAVK